MKAILIGFLLLPPAVQMCAGDFERFCAGQTPLPAIEDFQPGHIVNQCLKQHIRQLSPRCSRWLLEHA